MDLCYAFFQGSAAQHKLVSASQALDPEVGPGPQHGPLPASAGMLFFQGNGIPHANVHDSLPPESDGIQHFADGAGDHKVCLGIPGGGGLVDQDQLIAPVVVDQAGGGIDHQRGAAHDQHVSLGDVADGLIQDIHVQAFLVQDHVGLDAAAAAAHGDAFGVHDIFRVIELAAALAVVAEGAAVELQDVFAAGRLVEAVDVLGDDGFQLSFLFPLGQLFVGLVGLDAGHQELVPVVFEELFGHTRVAGMAEHEFRREFIFLTVEAVLASEIRYAAFGGNAGAAEKDDVAAACYDLS